MGTSSCLYSSEHPIWQTPCLLRLKKVNPFSQIGSTKPYTTSTQLCEAGGNSLIAIEEVYNLSSEEVSASERAAGEISYLFITNQVNGKQYVGSAKDLSQQ
jgi:hypothetical protein